MDSPNSTDAAAQLFRKFTKRYGWTTPKTKISFQTKTGRAAQDPRIGPQFAKDLPVGYKHWVPASLINVSERVPGVLSNEFMAAYMLGAHTFIWEFHNPYRLSLMTPGQHGWNESRSIVAPDVRTYDALVELYIDIQQSDPEVCFGNSDWFP